MINLQPAYAKTSCTCRRHFTTVGRLAVLYGRNLFWFATRTEIVLHATHLKSADTHLDDYAMSIRRVRDIFTMTHNLHTVFHKELTKNYEALRSFTTFYDDLRRNGAKYDETQTWTCREYCQDVKIETSRSKYRFWNENVPVDGQRRFKIANIMFHPSNSLLKQIDREPHATVLMAIRTSL